MINLTRNYYQNIANIPNKTVQSFKHTKSHFHESLTRNYYQNIVNIPNKIVQSLKNTKSHFRERARSGYFSPHYFTGFDSASLIQNSNNIPLIYHYSRHLAIKSISYSKTIISPVDSCNFLRLYKNYWWLSKTKL